MDFLKDSNDFLKDSIDFLKDSNDFLKGSIDFLKESIDFLRGVRAGKGGDGGSFFEPKKGRWGHCPHDELQKHPSRYKTPLNNNYDDPIFLYISY